jgi:DNA (cytosine-5)-methyltransferase 1
MNKHKFAYEWKLSEANFTKDKGKVFSCFACGGGSTMGYKLAGFDVLGCNEIDPKMMAAYKSNHNPKYAYLEPIQTFKLRDDLPNELYNLDILDGSPPCSSFSMAGSREEKWGVMKKFREGQAEQVLDELFFDFIDLAKKLQPKIVVAENVKGLLLGDAKSYVLRILNAFDEANYYVNYWLLDSSTMGVPQRRERVFFLAIRKDLAKPFLEQVDMFTIAPAIDLTFNEPEIPYGVIESPFREEKGRHIPTGVQPYWEKIEPGRSCADVHEKGHYFQELKLDPNRPLPTLRAGSNSYYHYKDARRLFDEEILKGGSYPIDYDFQTNQPIYLVGMSVPPVMTAQIASRIYEQWISKMNLHGA